MPVAKKEVDEDGALVYETITVNYTLPGNLTNSVLGEGGYVFQFDRTNLTDRTNGLTL